MAVVLHEGRQVQRRQHTVLTTLCGRSSNRVADGMNIADSRDAVTCKFCLRQLRAQSATPARVAPWFLYLLECSNGAYYAGITTDVDKRYAAHVDGKGARYTRANPPRRLIGVRRYDDRRQASRGEWEIRQLPKSDKPAFLQATEAALTRIATDE